jgi:hypothetical protein
LTASYDGKLVILEKEKRIEPCCEQMAQLVHVSAVKLGKVNNKGCIKVSFAAGDSKIAMNVNICPFCGAKMAVV